MVSSAQLFNIRCVLVSATCFYTCLWVILGTTVLHKRQPVDSLCLYCIERRMLSRQGPKFNGIFSEQGSEVFCSRR